MNDMEIISRASSPTADVLLVNYRFDQAPSSNLRVDGRFRIELGLSARHRTARACYTDYWQSNRYERVGEMFIIGPDTDVSARSDECGTMKAVVCEFDQDALLSWFDYEPAISDKHLTNSLDIKNARIRALLLDLASEARNPGFASSTFIEAVTTQLILELYRSGRDLRLHEAMFRQPLGGLASWQLRLIEERLSELRSAPTLEDLADMCRISVRQLTRAFRTSRGCSIGSCVRDSQSEHAKRLLADGECINAIAEMLGFSSASNFSSSFKRTLGQTPGQYRQTVLM